MGRNNINLVAIIEIIIVNYVLVGVVYSQFIELEQTQYNGYISENVRYGQLIQFIDWKKPSFIYTTHNNCDFNEYLFEISVKTLTSSQDLFEFVPNLTQIYRLNEINDSKKCVFYINIRFKLDLYVENQIINREAIDFYQLNVTINTNNSFLINLYVLDDNDNDPIYDQYEYLYEFSDFYNYTTRGLSIIGKISANDADLARNSMVRYFINAATLSPNPQNHSDFVSVNWYTGHLYLNYDLKYIFDQTNLNSISLEVKAIDNSPKSELFNRLSSSSDSNISVTGVLEQNFDITNVKILFNREQIDSNRVKIEFINASDFDYFDGIYKQLLANRTYVSPLIGIVKLSTNETNLLSYLSIEMKQSANSYLKFYLRHISSESNVAYYQIQYDLYQLASFRQLFQFSLNACLKSSSSKCWKLVDYSDYFENFFMVNLNLLCKFDVTKRRAYEKLSEFTAVNTIIYELSTKLNQNNEFCDYLINDSQLSVKYELNNYKNLFDLNEINGLLTVISELDREIYGDLLNLSVNAKLVHKNRVLISSSIVLPVHIEDENDNTPTIVNQTAVISIESAEKKVVYQVKAYDLDEGDNGRLVYSIESCFTGSLVIDCPFMIVSTNGSVVFIEDKVTTVPTTQLIIRVSDMGRPFRRYSFANLAIKTNNSGSALLFGHKIPQFETTNCTIHIRPHFFHVKHHQQQTAETVLYQFHAFDESSNTIEYRIMSGNEDNCFELDKISGFLYKKCFNKNKNRTLAVYLVDKYNQTSEINNLHIVYDDLSVKSRLEKVKVSDCLAVDQLQAHKEALKTPKISINTHKPQFDGVNQTNLIIFAINGVLKSGTFITKIEASDADSGFNGLIHYSLTNRSLFNIDQDGIVRVVSDLKFDFMDLIKNKTYKYSFSVHLNDYGEPVVLHCESDLIVHVEIIPIGEYTSLFPEPIFDKMEYRLNVDYEQMTNYLRNLLKPTIRLQTNRANLNLTDVYNVTYSLAVDGEWLSYSNDLPFLIDQKTGIIRTKARSQGFDRLYRFQVIANLESGSGLAAFKIASSVEVNIKSTKKAEWRCVNDEITGTIDLSSPFWSSEWLSYRKKALIGFVKVDFDESYDLKNTQLQYEFINMTTDNTKLLSIDRQIGAVYLNDGQLTQLISLRQSLMKEKNKTNAVIQLNTRVTRSKNDYKICNSKIEVKIRESKGKLRRRDVNRVPQKFYTNTNNLINLFKNVNVFTNDAFSIEENSIKVIVDLKEYLFGKFDFDKSSEFKDIFNRLEYTIINQTFSDNSYFEITNKTKLINRIQFDYELKKEYLVKIKVAQSLVSAELDDPEQNLYEYWLDLIINVRNRVDEPIICTWPVYNVSVKENEIKNKKLFDIKIQDFDGYPNKSEIKYKASIHSGNPYGLFYMNDLSLFLGTRKLDRALQSEHELDIKIFDSDHAERVTYCKLVVTVEGVNDNKPTVNDLTVSVYDKLDIQVPIVKIVALDLDGSSTFVYKIQRVTQSHSKLNKTQLNELFRVDQATGHVYSTQSQIPCSNCVFTIHYKVFDRVVDESDFNDTQRHSSRKSTIKVNVKKLGKEQPSVVETFRLGDNDNELKAINLQLKEDTRLGEKLYEVKTKYLNKHVENAYPIVNYFILNDTTNETFYVSTDDGSLYLIKTLDFETQSYYNFVILITNLIGQTVNLNITVNVIDVNDNRPRFLNDSLQLYSLNLSIGDSNAGIYESIDLVKGVDADSVDVDQLYYTIENCFYLSQTMIIVRNSSVAGDFNNKLNMLFPLCSSKYFEMDSKSARIAFKLNDIRHYLLENSDILLLTHPKHLKLSLFIDYSVKDSLAKSDSSRAIINFTVDLTQLSSARQIPMVQNLNEIEINRNTDIHFKNELYFIKVFENTHTGAQIFDFSEQIEFTNMNKPLKALDIRYIIENMGQDSIGIVENLGILYVKQINQTQLDNLTLNITCLLLDRYTANATVIFTFIKTSAYRYQTWTTQYIETYIDENSVVGSILQEKINNNSFTAARCIRESSQYSHLTSYVLRSHNDKFEIDKLTGFMSIKYVPDFEFGENEFNLTVLACYFNQMCVTNNHHSENLLIVNVKIRNLVDNGPILYPDNNQTGVIKLHLFPQQHLFTLYVFDVEKIESHPFRMRIENVRFNNETIETPFELFQYEQKRAYLLVSDYGYKYLKSLESARFYQFSIKCSITDGLFTSFLDLYVTFDLSSSKNKVPMIDYSFKIAENQMTNESIFTIIDPNLQSIEPITYKQLNYLKQFYVEPTTGFVYLTKNSTIDRERLENYELIVKAERESTTIMIRLIINVTNVNDNPPIFQLTNQTTQIQLVSLNLTFRLSDVLQSSALKPLYYFHATDIDRGINAKIEYRVVGYDTNTLNYSNMIVIDKYTGSFYLNTYKIDDVKSIKQLNFVIQAYDFGVPTLYSSELRVNVHLIDDNNQSLFDNNINIYKINEYLPSNQVITDLSIKNNRSVLLYSIRDGDYLNQFDIDVDNGQLKPHDNYLEYVKHSNYALVINALNPFTYVSTNKTIFIELVQENNTKPQFTNREYVTEISENLPPYTHVYQFNAVNTYRNTTQVLYRLENHLDLFALDELSGNLYTKYAFDYESMDKLNVIHNDDDKIDSIIEHSFKLRIKAFNIDTPHVYSTCYLTVKIIDINDNPPQFDKFEYNYELEVLVHDEPMNSTTRLSSHYSTDSHNLFVTKLNARDLDLNTQPPTNLTYKLVTLQSDYNQIEMNLFNVDAHAAIVRLNLANFSVYRKLVDIKERTKFNFTRILVADDSMHSTYTRLNIHVSLLDSEPQTNQKSLFKQVIFNCTINEDALPGTHIETLVDDVDWSHQKSGTKVNFFIVNGDPFNQFTIKSGKLYSQMLLDSEISEYYDLDIMAFNGFYQQFSKIYVKIKDINDRRPVCLSVNGVNQTKYSLNISETIQLNEIIVQLSVFDNDLSSSLKYTIVNDDSLDQLPFAIDSKLGFLMVNSSLDYEIKREYDLIVRVLDESSNYCEFEINVRVIDENNNPPICEFDMYYASCEENSPVDTYLTHVKASDRDSGVNGMFVFEIESNTYVKIDPKLGAIRVNSNELDREVIGDWLNLTIIVRDLGIPQPLNSTCLFTLKIIDVNDEIPIFEKDSYYLSVQENLPIGYLLTEVRAIDKDVNSTVKYQLVNGTDSGLFKLDEVTGEVSVNGPLDYEKQSHFEVTIEAFDPEFDYKRVNRTFNSTKLIIDSIDLNDNKPIFDKNEYKFEINENCELNTTVGYVHATDLDRSKSNNQVKYKILSGNDDNVFDLDENNGRLFTINQVDYELVSKYELVIEAADNGEPRQVNKTTVFIRVNNLNDNKPIFKRENQTLIFAENFPLGQQITKFEVSDADDPLNVDQYTFVILEQERIDPNDETVKLSSPIFSVNHNGNLILIERPLFNYTYVIKVRVYDNQIPPLYSDTYLTIKITDKTTSSNSPVLNTTLINIVLVDQFATLYDGYIIGQVKANEIDPYDQLYYELHDDQTGTFQMNKMNGLVKLTKNLSTNEVSKQYSMTVSVINNRKIKSEANLSVNVDSIIKSCLYNSVVSKIKLNPPVKKQFKMDYFIGNGYLKRFKESLKRYFNKSIDVISVRDDGSNTFEVIFTVPKSPKACFSGKTLVRLINKNRKVLVKRLRSTTHSDLRVRMTELTHTKQCTNNEICSNANNCRLKFDKNYHPTLCTSALNQTICDLMPKYKWLCVAEEPLLMDDEDFNEDNRIIGSLSEAIQPQSCKSTNNPCKNNAICKQIRKTKKLMCFCAHGFTGRHCENDINECELLEKPCLNDAICANTFGSYKCANCSTHGENGGHSDLSETNCYNLEAAQLFYAAASTADNKRQTSKVLLNNEHSSAEKDMSDENTFTNKLFNVLTTKDVLFGIFGALFTILFILSMISLVMCKYKRRKCSSASITVIGSSNNNSGETVNCEDIDDIDDDFSEEQQSGNESSKKKKQKLSLFKRNNKKYSSTNSRKRLIVRTSKQTKNQQISTKIAAFTTESEAETDTKHNSAGSYETELNKLLTSSTIQETTVKSLTTVTNPIASTVSTTTTTTANEQQPSTNTFQRHKHYEQINVNVTSTSSSTPSSTLTTPNNHISPDNFISYSNKRQKYISKSKLLNKTFFNNNNNNNKSSTIISNKQAIADNIEIIKQNDLDKDDSIIDDCQGFYWDITDWAGAGAVESPSTKMPSTCNSEQLTPKNIVIVNHNASESFCKDDQSHSDENNASKSIISNYNTYDEFPIYSQVRKATNKHNQTNTLTSTFKKQKTEDELSFNSNEDNNQNQLIKSNIHYDEIVGTNVIDVDEDDDTSKLTSIIANNYVYLLDECDNDLAKVDYESKTLKPSSNTYSCIYPTTFQTQIRKDKKQQQQQQQKSTKQPQANTSEPYYISTHLNDYLPVHKPVNSTTLNDSISSYASSTIDQDNTQKSNK